MLDSIHLLKTKRFLPLFLTQFLGAFNDNAFKNAFLIWFTYDVAAKSGINAPMMVTLAAGLFILPFFLFSATAGQVVDKYEKSWLTQKIKQVEIILMCCCAVFFFLESVYGLLVILFLMGVQSTFFSPIKYSLLPEHLKDRELIAGNGLIEGGTFLSILLGTIFGGLIIRTEYGMELLSCFVIGFAIIGWVSSRSIPNAPIGDPQLKIGWNIIAETWKIIGFARKERTVWLSIISISWFWLIGVTFLTQFPTYAKEVIGGDEHVVTLFLGLFSIGIGIGSVSCNRLLNGEINGRFVPMGCLGMSIFIIDFYLASRGYTGAIFMQKSCALGAECLPVLEGISDFLSTFEGWRITFDLLMIAICSGIYIVPLYAIMQHRSDDHYLARIIAANNVLNALFMVVATLIALTLFSFDLQVIDLFLVAGIANLIVFFIVRKAVKRRLKHA